MVKQHTRRDFIYNTSVAGLGLMGFGAFLQSCAEKGVVYSKDLAKVYIEGLKSIIGLIRERELPNIEKAAGLAVQSKLQGHNLYVVLNGGMLPGELKSGRPGNPGVFITTDVQKASREDFVLSNDPYIVHGFGERMVKVVGLTTPQVLNNQTPPGALKNMGTLRLEDVADTVIYCHVPATDGIIAVEGIEIPLFPASGIIQTMIFYTFVSDIMENLARHGVYYTAE
ncbi:hypothetical protein LLG96_08940 [bacterium]|nr:hypothetical protein [bacterium]